MRNLCLHHSSHWVSPQLLLGSTSLSNINVVQDIDTRSVSIMAFEGLLHMITSSSACSMHCAGTGTCRWVAGPCKTTRTAQILESLLHDTFNMPNLLVPKTQPTKVTLAWQALYLSTTQRGVGRRFTPSHWSGAGLCPGRCMGQTMSQWNMAEAHLAWMAVDAVEPCHFLPTCEVCTKHAGSRLQSPSSTVTME